MTFSQEFCIHDFDAVVAAVVVYSFWVFFPSAFQHSFCFIGLYFRSSSNIRRFYFRATQMLNDLCALNALCCQQHIYRNAFSYINYLIFVATRSFFCCLFFPCNSSMCAQYTLYVKAMKWFQRQVEWDRDRERARIIEIFIHLNVQLCLRSNQRNTNMLRISLIKWKLTTDGVDETRQNFCR